MPNSAGTAAGAVRGLVADSPRVVPEVITQWQLVVPLSL